MYTGNKHNWTLREDALLRSGWLATTASDLADRIGVSKIAIKARARRLGLQLPIQRVEPVAPVLQFPALGSFFSAAPERQARGYEPLPAGNALSWGAICENSVGAIL